MLDNTPELSYLTQVVIRLFCDKRDPNKRRCEIYFSPGATNNPLTEGKSPLLAPYVMLNKSISCDELCECLDAGIVASRQRSDGSISNHALCDLVYETDKKSKEDSENTKENGSAATEVADGQDEVGAPLTTPSSSPRKGFATASTPLVTINSSLMGCDTWEFDPDRRKQGAGHSNSKLPPVTHHTPISKRMTASKLVTPSSITPGAPLRTRGNSFYSPHSSEKASSHAVEGQVDGAPHLRAHHRKIVSDHDE